MALLKNLLRKAPESQNEVLQMHLQNVPVDVEALAYDLGLNLKYEDLPDDIAGKLERDWLAPAGFRITVDSSDGHRRKRFTIAHEIAHYMLHRDLLPEEGVTDSALYRSSLSDDMERHANRFAAQILLPETKVREAYRSEKSLAALSRIFDVSDAALRIRLKELRLGA